jgi:glycine/D-amino acid oxidase-like deaminating enzyme
MRPGPYDDVSFWMADAGPIRPRPALPGNRDVDVAVLGAGLTGLWTATELLRRRPGLQVAVIEAETAGFGGSGRNGSWCVAGLGLTLGGLARRFGDDTARRVSRVMRDTVDEVGRFCTEEGVDASFHKSGVLRVARGRHELPAVTAAWDLRRRLGLTNGCAVLDADELQQRVRVNRGVGALADAHGATVHPARLVRGLADVLERQGGTLWEQTRVTDVHTGGGSRRPRLRTPLGDVTASAVVLAGEAWLSQLPRMRRRVLPLYSLIVLTDPLPDEHWDAIGWRGREALSSHRLSVDYLARTADNRVLLGGRGAPYHLGSRIQPDYDHHPPTHDLLRAQLRDWFPQIGQVGFSHQWGGPVAMPRDWLPTFSFDPRTGVAAAYGYTGQGVAAANLAGRVLADQITGAGGLWADLPMVRLAPRRWEPEPLRWLAVRYLQGAIGRSDARAARSGRPPAKLSVVQRLLRH